MPFEGLDIVVIAIVVLIILVLFAGIKTVKQGNQQPGQKTKPHPENDSIF